MSDESSPVMIFPEEEIALAVPQQEHPGLWRRLLAAFRDEPLPRRVEAVQPSAHIIITIDTKTLEITRVDIYSCHAASLTVGSMHHCHVDGPAAHGKDYEDAERNLVKTLKAVSFYNWMFDRLPERYRKIA